MSVMTITKENFDREVLESDRPVLLDFWAEWCGHCRAMSPVVDEIAREREDVKVGKVNVDDQSELAERFGVMGIPILVVMQNGQETDRAVGAQPKERVLNLLP